MGLPLMMAFIRSAVKTGGTLRLWSGECNPGINTQVIDVAGAVKMGTGRQGREAIGEGNATQQGFGGWGWEMRLAAGDLWRERGYRRLWLAILTGAFGGQITTVSLALLSALQLGATPTQIGLLGASWIAPFALFSLPFGVWLDRVRKLPVYVAGEAVLAATLASVALAWYGGMLGMGYLYAVSFVCGCVSVVSGTTAQVVLTQVVARERLVEAHARNGLATSSAEILGPGLAGALIRLVGAPAALLLNAGLLLSGVWLLRGIRAEEPPTVPGRRVFWGDLVEGVRFVLGHPLLRALALAVGIWQICQTVAMVGQVLFATRTLGLSESQYGLCFSAAGLGTVLASTLGPKLSRRIGLGPCLVAGIALSAMGWLQLAAVPPGAGGMVAFMSMLVCFSAGSVLIFSNMLALRQALTPPEMLARMTSTMRFLTLLPAGVGSLLGGWVGEYFELRTAIACGGLGALLLALAVWRFSCIRHVFELPARPDATF